MYRVSFFIPPFIGVSTWQGAIFPSSTVATTTWFIDEGLIANRKRRIFQKRVQIDAPFQEELSNRFQKVARTCSLPATTPTTPKLIVIASHQLVVCRIWSESVLVQVIRMQARWCPRGVEFFHSVIYYVYRTYKAAMYELWQTQQTASPSQVNGITSTEFFGKHSGHSENAGFRKC
jgi:hypothetical protein